MSVEPADYVARLRTQASDPAFEEMMRRDRKMRRIKIGLGAGAGALLLTGFGFWLADTLGSRPPYEPYGAQTLDERLWPLEWPYTVDMPFRNSPATGWPEGADGIYVPPANSERDAEYVTAVLESVKTLLTETNLAEDTLTGVEPTKALALLDPSGTDAAVRRDLVTRFDPEEVRPHPGTEVRTRGAMTYEVTATGEVEVRADYTFVYPLIRLDAAHDVIEGVPEVARVAVRRQLTLTSKKGKLLVSAYASEFANTDCAAPKDGPLHPLFADGRWKAGQATEGVHIAMADLYAENRVLRPGPGQCVVPSGT